VTKVFLIQKGLVGLFPENNQS